MHKFTKISIYTLLSLSVIFILQNLHNVPVSFLFWTADLPVATLIGVMLVVGFIIGFLISRGRRMLFKEH
ncbi:LapA family protein [Aliiglaciecola sp. LCG003]|uniref:LapA family protein n=1 Tax=Aliiglaciecola sp. LCG003 TaxID=3053655 RepID=UPI002573B6B3|nr:LapA family protein [Aliiglaciecola sp. LCG003]WJG09776.1 LapA family protein [Aliiglaciecola sp. LCG003]